MTQNTALTLRTVAEMTQVQASTLLGVSVRSWKAWEANEPPMSLKKAKAFRDAIHRLDQGGPAPTNVYPGEHPQTTLNYEALHKRGMESKLDPNIYFWKKRPKLSDEELGYKPETTPEPPPETPTDEEERIDLEGATTEELTAISLEITRMRSRESAQPSQMRP